MQGCTYYFRQKTYYWHKVSTHPEKQKKKKQHTSFAATLEKSGRKTEKKIMKWKWKWKKDKNRRINIKLPAVWEPKCCATCDNKKNNFALPAKLPRIVPIVCSHCRHLFRTMWPRLFAKTKPTSGCRRRSWQMDKHLSGHNDSVANPLLLFKLNRKLPSKTRTNCRGNTIAILFSVSGIPGG